MRRWLFAVAALAVLALNLSHGGAEGLHDRAAQWKFWLYDSLGVRLDTTDAGTVRMFRSQGDTTGSTEWFVYHGEDTSWTVAGILATELYQVYYESDSHAYTLLDSLVLGTLAGDTTITRWQAFADTCIPEHAFRDSTIFPRHVTDDPDSAFSITIGATGSIHVSALPGTVMLESEWTDWFAPTFAESLLSVGHGDFDTLAVDTLTVRRTLVISDTSTAAGDASQAVWLRGWSGLNASMLKVGDGVQTGGLVVAGDMVEHNSIDASHIETGAVGADEISDGTVDSTETYTPLCEAVLKTDNIYERSATSDRINLFAAFRPDSAHYDTVRVSTTVALAGTGVSGLRTGRILWKSGAKAGDIVLVMPYSGAWPTYGYGATAITHRQVVFNGIVTADKKVEIVAQVDALWTGSAGFAYASGDNAFHVWVLGRP